jgi:peptide deformylase
VAVFPIRLFGDPVLNTETQLVTEFDDRLRKLIDDMIETMYDAPGVGLAAPQIGVNKRLFVYDAGDEQGARVVLNAELLSSDGEWEFDEGCLSVPGLFFPITRAEHVVVKGLDRGGKEIEIDTNQYEARILQHEIDHLNGHLLLSKVTKDQRKEAMRVLRERATGAL